MTAARRWLPRAGVVVTAALFVVTNVMAFQGSYAGASEDLFSVALTTALLAFPVVGMLLVRRSPENVIGWLFCAAGPIFGLMISSQTYVENYILAEGVTGGFADLTLWVAVWTGPIAYSLITAFLLLLFPTGRLLSRRWRAAAFLTAGSVAVLVIGSMLARELDDYDQLENPYAIGGAFEKTLEAARGVGWILLSISVLLAGISLIVRFRRSKGVEREQLKWMAFAASLLFVSQVSWFVSEGLAQVLTGLSFLALPIAVCIAILRYRLYDIDLIINRTLVYGALTALLAAAYFGIVVLLQGLVPGAGDSEVTVAGSTLAVAALFRPLRGRVQAFIDRRFYRRKFDAQRTLDAFTVRLRDEVDLDQLSSSLVGVVRETMQPAHASVWMRPREVAR
jgi:MFS family permease